MVAVDLLGVVQPTPLPGLALVVAGSGDNSQRLNTDNGFVFRILDMKVGRGVVVEVHLDDDSVEAADLRH